LGLYQQRFSSEVEKSIEGEFYIDPRAKDMTIEILMRASN
jgi:hypothetical protein